MNARDRVPVMIMRENGREAFARWMRSHRPDAVVSFGGPAVEWMKELGLKSPADVGFVELDLSDKSGRIAGIDQHSESLAATAVDLLVAQLHRSEYGSPKLPKLILVEGTWVSGATVRRQRRRS